MAESDNRIGDVMLNDFFIILFFQEKGETKFPILSSRDGLCHDLTEMVANRLYESFPILFLTKKKLLFYVRMILLHLMHYRIY